jgi:hypothetical protein
MTRDKKEIPLFGKTQKAKKIKGGPFSSTPKKG